MSEEDKQLDSLDDSPVNEETMTDPTATSESTAAVGEADANHADTDVFPVSDAEGSSSPPIDAASEDGDTTPTAPDDAPATEDEGDSQLKQQLQSLQEQVEERTVQYMRIAADFENYRKRTDREKGELEQRIKRETISELLPVIDNFERARSQIKAQTEAESTIHKSYQGIYKQLVDCLKRTGVAPMRAAGKVFDPNLHEAVMREPTTEFEEGVVMEELVNGYMLGDLVLRHAMVKVAAPPETSDTDASSETLS